MSGLAISSVSRETRERLERFTAEVSRWQKVQNLVGTGTLDQIWERHVLDSLQLIDHEPHASTWLDLGSGAGFPGLVLGISFASRPEAMVHLVECNSRKCAFLRHAARVTGAKVQVHEERLETTIKRFVGKVDVVTARALAPLDQMFDWTEPLIAQGAVGLFPKGRNYKAELTDAAGCWKFTADMLPSQTDSQARVVRVTTLEKRSRPAIEEGL